jgi:hypothetical protein
MGDFQYFDRLLATAGLIVRHADYPGKRQMVERCREEVIDLTRAGRITAAQGVVLQEILLGVGHQTA